VSDPEALTLHATAVAVHGRAVLLSGASGSGKSSLALEMMARGATLVADDRVILSEEAGHILLTCPDPLLGLIEARGVGLLYAAYQSPVPLALVVDMDITETERMPAPRRISYFTQTLPLLHKVDSRHFPAAILQYLRADGRAYARA